MTGWSLLDIGLAPESVLPFLKGIRQREVERDTGHPPLVFMGGHRYVPTHVRTHHNTHTHS